MSGYTSMSNNIPVSYSLLYNGLGHSFKHQYPTRTIPTCLWIWNAYICISNSTMYDSHVIFI